MLWWERMELPGVFGLRNKDFLLGGKPIMRTKSLLLVLGSFIGTVAAQTPVDPMARGLPPLPGKAGMMTMQVDDMDASPVKGAPFCATVTTEHTQAFADGNRIHTTNDSSLCRDSEGRTRRDAGLEFMGAAPPPDLPKLIT